MFTEAFELEMHDAKTIKRIWIIDWIGAMNDLLASVFSPIQVDPLITKKSHRKNSCIRQNVVYRSS